MKKDTRSVFTVADNPWYDGTRSCLAVMVLMAVIHYFGWSGIAACVSRAEWKGYWHLPVILIISSLSVFLSVAVRIISRHLLKKTGDSSDISL